MIERQTVMVIGHVWPEPGSSAAGQRMMQLLSFFRSQGWAVTFVSTSATSKYMQDPELIGMDTSAIEVNSSQFDVFIRDLQPSIVVFDRFMTEEQFGWRVAEQYPGALRILNMEDMHCLRKARHHALKEGETFAFRHLLSHEVAKREIASVYRSDLSLVISEVEMEIMRSEFKIPRAQIHYLPFMLDPVDEPVVQKHLSFDSRNDFIHIGNFLHEPNFDSVLYMKNEIWPLIREQLPAVKLLLFGAYPPQKAFELHHPETGFMVQGRADDAKAEVGKARICLAPLRFGAGLKGKLVEAMECGTPSITTQIGAEGISGDLPWSGLIVRHDQPGKIADAAVKLYTDAILWQQSVERGYQIINKRFLKKVHTDRLKNRILGLQTNLSKHRLNNFTGAMLRHHTMAGTKYMSRWIEAKNRVEDLTGGK